MLQYRKPKEEFRKQSKKTVAEHRVPSKAKDRREEEFGSTEK
jgi:hypothetical protein